MLRFKYIEMRNFLSYGNVTQRVDLECSPLTIILGLNNDATGNESEEETRNGVGKSSVIQALNFVLYGKSVANKIKVGNLINKTNKKNCEVTLVFEKDGVQYTIIRKRGPTDLIFMVGDTRYEETVDEAQGDNRDSQDAITSVIGMSQDLFTQIVTITTSVESFLELPAGKQRQLIEELLTITQLSEKAEKLKEMLKQIKEAISREQFRVETVEASNQKILQSISLLEQQAADYNTNQRKRMVEINTTLSTLQSVDIEKEKRDQELVRTITEHNKKSEQLILQLKQAQQRTANWKQQQVQKINDTKNAITQLSAIDIEQELANHESLALWYQLSTILDNNNAEQLRLERDEAACAKRANKHDSEIKRLTAQLEQAYSAECPTCGGLLSDDKHTSVVTDLKTRIEAEELILSKEMAELALIENKINAIDHFELPIKPVTQYTNANDAYQHRANVEALHSSVDVLVNEESPYLLQEQELLSQQVDLIVDIPTTVYANAAQVYQHESAVEQLTAERLKIESSINPYDNQIDTLKENSLQDVNYDELNRMRKTQEHQEFLVKLLTDKNSFVRKRIIDQNLGFLNQRLQVYMEKSGSQHNVLFMNDLTVAITKMGDDYDFDNLSRGEKNRVIIALSIAFRDMFESLNFGVNTLMIDEILDNGLDKAGTNACYKMLNDLSNQHDKNCFLITHREELQSRCENIMMVIMENGFTTVEQHDGE